jgi:hypothetical protein
MHLWGESLFDDRSCKFVEIRLFSQTAGDPSQPLARTQIEPRRYPIGVRTLGRIFQPTGGDLLSKFDRISPGIPPGKRAGVVRPIAQSWNGSSQKLEYLVFLIISIISLALERVWDILEHHCDPWREKATDQEGDF